MEKVEIKYLGRSWEVVEKTEYGVFLRPAQPEKDPYSMEIYLSKKEYINVVEENEQD